VAAFRFRLLAQHTRIEYTTNNRDDRMNPFHQSNCGGLSHLNRRTLLGLAGAAGASWLTPVAELLADPKRSKRRAKSIIVLWMAGGPSQLETFDPHAGSAIAGETKAIETNVKGIQLAEGLERIAQQMDSLAIVRSVTSKEGDHERATYNVKTGFRPDPTLIHPSIGAVACYQLTDKVEIPRHVSILPNQWPGRGGYLGDHFDAFKIGDPKENIPDVKPRVSDKRQTGRLTDLDVLEAGFSKRRLRNLELGKTLHRKSIESALRMMSSDQLAAFNVTDAPQSVRDEFGDTPFGRGCLAAVRLVESGVRCVEVTLNGWDSHAKNQEIQRGNVDILDPAFASLIKELKSRDLYDDTIVLCGGEFGRTPRINGLGGRDHWPHGFSVVLGGGGFRGGTTFGTTSHEPKLDKEKPLQDVESPRNIADIHATILHLLGIDFEVELNTPIGRPMAISKGVVIQELIS